ncbi:MAG: hypothetical protein FWG98_10510 [Candidatus Cloacimonetes bacterium]|nr:hypothetical protein [Candidatus Cloacimonadota bacterium]
MNNENIIFIAFMTCVSITLTAQMYFDGGIGIGHTHIMPENSNINLELSYDHQIGVSFDLKAGYALSSKKKIYLTAEISGVGQRFMGIEGTEHYIQLNSYLLGSGIIVYPHPNFQLSTSFGYSFTGNTTDIPLVHMGEGIGAGFNVSSAFDVYQEKNSMLIGIKFHYSKTSPNSRYDHTLEFTNTKLGYMFFGVFVRYRFSG